MGGCAVIAGAALVIARVGRVGVLARLARGLAALRQGGSLRIAVAQTAVYMVLEMLILYTAAHAAGAHVGLGAALFGFLGAQLGFLIPGPPSSIAASSGADRNAVRPWLIMSSYTRVSRRPSAAVRAFSGAR